MHNSTATTATTTTSTSSRDTIHTQHQVQAVRFTLQLALQGQVASGPNGHQLGIVCWETLAPWRGFGMRRYCFCVCVADIEAQTKRQRLFSLSRSRARKRSLWARGNQWHLVSSLPPHQRHFAFLRRHNEQSKRKRFCSPVVVAASC